MSRTFYSVKKEERSPLFITAEFTRKFSFYADGERRKSFLVIFATSAILSATASYFYLFKFTVTSSFVMLAFFDVATDAVIFFHITTSFFIIAVPLNFITKH